MITFASDLHLLLNNRIDDFKKVLMEQILPEANKSTLFVIVGDIYHERKPHPIEQNIFRDFIVQVKVPTVIIVGNHDENLSATTLDEITKYNIQDVKLLRPPQLIEVEGLKIYLDHALYEGAKLGPSNLNLNLKGSKKLDNLPIADYYIFGHVHKAQVLRKVPLTIYVGSIDRIDFAERNEDKYIFQIDEKTKKFGFKKLVIRPMLQIDLDLGKDEKMFTASTKDAIVKVVISGTREQIKKFNEAELREALNKSLSYKLIYSIIRENISRSKNVSESKSVGDCFEEYSKLNNLDEITVKRGKEIISETN